MRVDQEYEVELTMKRVKVSAKSPGAAVTAALQVVRRDVAGHVERAGVERVAPTIESFRRR